MSSSGPQAGDPVPTFDLPTDDGGRVSSAALASQPFVIYFYPKDDTSGCTKEALGFTEAYPKFKARGVEVIGVSKDDARSHKKFRDKHGLSFPLATDADGTVLEAFGSWVEKSMYGKKYMGTKRSTFLVDGKGRIVKAWRGVKIPGHVDEVLAAAEQAS